MKPTKAAGKDPMAEYHLVTDTIGGLNLRGKDNLYQTIAILVSVAIGASIGALIAGKWWVGVLFGTFIALVISVFVSGIVLMVLGWVRAARYSKERRSK